MSSLNWKVMRVNTLQQHSKQNEILYSQYEYKITTIIVDNCFTMYDVIAWDFFTTFDLYQKYHFKWKSEISQTCNTFDQ